MHNCKISKANQLPKKIFRQEYENFENKQKVGEDNTIANVNDIQCTKQFELNKLEETNVSMKVGISQPLQMLSKIITRNMDISGKIIQLVNNNKASKLLKKAKQVSTVKLEIHKSSWNSSKC